MAEKKYQAVLYDGYSRPIARIVGRSTRKEAETDIDLTAKTIVFDHAKIEETYYPSAQEEKKEPAQEPKEG